MNDSIALRLASTYYHAAIQFGQKKIPDGATTEASYSRVLEKEEKRRLIGIEALHSSEATRRLGLFKNWRIGEAEKYRRGKTYRCEHYVVRRGRLLRFEGVYGEATVCEQIDGVLSGFNRDSGDIGLGMCGEPNSRLKQASQGQICGGVAFGVEDNVGIRR